MWRRLYLFLLAVRLYFALQPTILHPDEHFQGPEVMAGQVFGWPATKTWEFTSQTPIRSYFPLWLAYGFPLTIMKWIWEGLNYGDVPPMAAFYTLRVLMFVLSFVLEDWALHELIASPRERTRAIALVASSYVTWTFQTHTFSNSIETLLVLWCIVLMRRIREHPESTMASACCGLAFMMVLGVFNRITFPAFLVAPAVQFIPHLFTRTLRIPLLAVASMATLAVAFKVDTEIYAIPGFRNSTLKTIFTPLNNVLYNLDPNNLAKHGLHPFWLHFAVNMPLLLGPAVPLIWFSARTNVLFWSATVGNTILSCFQHQEPRFLLASVPLLLASVKLPERFSRVWLATWIIFNAVLGLVFGVYHQGGIIPAQRWLVQQDHVAQVYWWKTYSPPKWLESDLNATVTTKDLMGLDKDRLLPELFNKGSCDVDGLPRTLLVAPASATVLDEYIEGRARKQTATVRLKELWRYSRHIGLDDLDFGEDGVGETLHRVLGRRGLVVWQVDKKC